MTTKEEDDAEAIARAHEMGDLLEDALFKTFLAADNHGSLQREARRASKKAWRTLVDKIIEFAMDDDR